jgi:hypothetical protein
VKITALLLSLLVIMSILPYMDQTFAALSVSIETSQETYHYGDNLSMTIIVSEITGDIATVYIIDTEERKGTLLSPPITKKLRSFLHDFLLTQLYGRLVHIR